MDLQTIANRTSIPIRRLRYVLDHRVLPGAEKASRGHRVTRSFTDIEAIGIAIAAALLHAGLRRPLVQRCVKMLMKPASVAPKQELLLAITDFTGDVRLEVANGEHLRVTAHRSWDTGWRPLRPKIQPLQSEPLVVLRLDAATIRDHVKGRSTSVR